MQLFSQNIPFIDVEHKTKKKHGSNNFADKGFKDSSKISQTLIEDFGEAPGLTWANQFGGSGNDNVRAVDFDPYGNIFVTGSFSGSLFINENTYQSIGSKDAFVAKLDEAGQIVWFSQISAQEENIAVAYDISIDNSGLIYVIGSYTGSLTIGGSVLPNTTVESAFVAKIYSDGEVISGIGHHNDSFERGNSVDTDEQGNVYAVTVTSSLSERNHGSCLLKYNAVFELIWEEYFDEGFEEIIIRGDYLYAVGILSLVSDGILNNNISMNIPENNEVFAAKSNLDGVFDWALSAVHTGDGSSYNPNIDMDGNGNLYISGLNYRTISFGDCGTIDGRAFLMKLNDSGTCQWMNSLINIQSVFVDENGTSYSFYSDNGYYIFNSDGVYQDQLSLEVSAWESEIYNGKIFSSSAKDGIMRIGKSNTNGTNDWENVMDGNSAFGEVYATDTDSFGNLYTYFYVSNTVDYWGSEIERGLFLSKQNSNGNIVWTKHFGDHLQDFSVGDLITVDTISNCIYVTGISNTDLDIPGGPTLEPVALDFVYIIKYTLEGDYLWSIQEDFNGDGLSVEVDVSGGVIFSGLFQGPTLIGDVLLNSQEGSLDGFLAKYNASGEFLWAIAAGGESIEYIFISYVDAEGNIFISGEFISENIMIGNYSITLEEHDGNVLVAKLDPNGNVLWAKAIAASPVDYNDYYAWPTGMRIDPEGSVYIKGNHTDSTYFDDIILTSPNKWSKFITKLDSDGQVLWAKSIHEVIRGNDYCQMDIDQTGNVYFGAQSRDTVLFGDDYEYVSSSYNDLFIAKYNMLGDLKWVKTIQGNEYPTNYIKSVAVCDSMVFVSGYKGNYLAVDNSELLSYNKYGFSFLFSNGFLGIEPILGFNSFNVFPNPSTGLITIESENEMLIEIVNAQGQVVFHTMVQKNQQMINLGFLPKGVYWMMPKNNSGYKSKAIIIE